MRPPLPSSGTFLATDDYGRRFTIHWTATLLENEGHWEYGVVSANTAQGHRVARRLDMQPGRFYVETPDGIVYVMTTDPDASPLPVTLAGHVQPATDSDRDSARR